MVPAVLESATQFMSCIPPGCRLLDVGCGHGRETAWFASRGFNTTAFDLSAGMLKQAAKLLTSGCIQGDMQHLPFQDHSFSALWCNAALLHVPKSQTGPCLSEFHRILTSSGYLYIALQAGEDEVWESQSYGMIAPRFFAGYSFVEGQNVIEAAGFHVIKQTEYRQGPRAHWLHYIAHT